MEISKKNMGTSAQEGLSLPSSLPPPTLMPIPSGCSLPWKNVDLLLSLCSPKKHNRVLKKILTKVGINPEWLKLHKNNVK